MRKILAVFLLIVFSFGNVISQAHFTSQQTKQDDKQNTASETKRPTKLQRKKWRQRQIAKLRKENRRLRAIIAWQKRMLARKGFRNANRNGRKSNRNTARTSRKSTTTKSTTTILATPIVTQEQLDKIKSDVKSAVLADIAKQPAQPTFTSEQVAVIVREELKKQIAANGGVLPTPPPSPDDNGAGTTSGDSYPSMFGAWVSEKWSSAKEWVSANPYLATLAALVLILIVVLLLLWRKGKLSRVRRSSLEPSRFSRIYLWFKGRWPFSRKAEKLTIIEEGGLDPESELYKDLKDEAGAVPINSALKVEQPLASEAGSGESVAQVADEVSDENPTSVEKRVYKTIVPVTES